MQVGLIDSMGSDLRIVQAAKVSVGRNRQVEWDVQYATELGFDYVRKLKQADHGIVSYMLRNHHGTPFEHVLFTYYIQTNIGIMREMQRHRWAGFNELSTRYALMIAEFDIPELSDFRTQVGKPGHYTFEPIPLEAAQEMHTKLLQQCLASFDLYEELVTVGVGDQKLAKEIARGVLPLFLSTEAYMTLNLRSLFNFCGLRLESTALREIQYIAHEMFVLGREVVPETLQLWSDQGKPVGDFFHDCDACDYHFEEVA